MNLLSGAEISIVSVVRIRESRYYGGFFLKKISENFVGTLETVRIREVSVPRGSTVSFSTTSYRVKGFESGSHFKSRLSFIVRVNVVLNKTVVVDID